MKALADDIEHVRQRPEQFFRGGSPEPVGLVTHIVWMQCSSSEGARHVLCAAGLVPHQQQ
jgi:hypothetical protein